MIDNAGRTMKYQGQAASDLPPRYLMITGPKALQSLERTRTPAPLSPAQLDWMRTRGWLRSPDGSTPITISPAMRGPVPPSSSGKNASSSARRSRNPGGVPRVPATA